MELTVVLFLIFLSVVLGLSIWVLVSSLTGGSNPVNGTEASVKGYKLIARGKFECQTNMLSKNFVNVHFEEGGFCIARGIDTVPFKKGTMIRVYQHKHNKICKVVEDSKFLDVPF